MEGRDRVEVAALFKVSARAVDNWWAKWQAGGRDALLSRPATMWGWRCRRWKNLRAFALARIAGQVSSCQRRTASGSSTGRRGRALSECGVSGG
ncbi:helix-turn-helix domain containing protein [Streptomyces sp. NBC_00885]|nr:helix-turn-helix domain containing protein [Streptomyces sp. NBC_00885]